MPKITIPATLEYLSPVKDYLKAEIPAEFAAQTSNVLLVAEELLVNVFSYAYPEGKQEEAEITIGTVDYEGETYLQFTVRDWGQIFNPFEEAPAPDLTADVEDRHIGGLGIFLIKQVSAHQFWNYEDESNFIRILFHADAPSL